MKRDRESMSSKYVHRLPPTPGGGGADETRTPLGVIRRGVCLIPKPHWEGGAYELGRGECM